jgi:hypothetical protein
MKYGAKNSFFIFHSSFAPEGRICERDSSGTTRRGGARPRPCAKRTKGDGADSPTLGASVACDEAARPKTKKPSRKGELYDYN